ncbi:MAG TPA: HAMP domain-containing sensor histidine kinase [Verrucomicrobiae bacterium]
MKKPAAKTPTDAARLRQDLLTIGSRICHDLRTPLGGISISVELLRETLGEEPAATGALASMFASLEEMTRIITVLSVVAKATAKPGAKQKVRMAEVITGVLQHWERRIQEKGATVKEPPSWPEVSGVTEWLEFIWSNLVANVLQHGGRKIELGWTKVNKEMKFWIADDGPGMPPDVVARLFQPFETLHEPGSSRGLGLAVIRRLVELQGGRCGLDAAAKLTTFYFTLPK